MRWDQVVLTKITVFLPKAKKGEARTVPLAPTAIEILKGVPSEPPDYVFELTSDQITGFMKRAVKKAGLVDLRFHDLRHEATSRLFENTDLHVMKIKGITDHKSMQMLARYAHLRAGRLADRLVGKER
jgi:integrase